MGLLLLTNPFNMRWKTTSAKIPASFCTPKPNMPITQVSFEFLLLHSNSTMKRTSFLMLVLGLVGFHRTDWTSTSSALVWLGHRLELMWCWRFAWKWTEMISCSAFDAVYLTLGLEPTCLGLKPSWNLWYQLSRHNKLRFLRSHHRKNFSSVQLSESYPISFSQSLE